ncbi:MAG: HAD-IB family phosphatase [Chloroflexi bacterium]|nr:HAD-IB family phosphatase [Chloroflexota bacterium]
MIIASDLEGTLTSGATWRGIAGYLMASGRAADYNRFLIPRLPMVGLYRANLLDGEAFRNRWIAGLLNLFTGCTEDQFNEAAEFTVEEQLWPNRRETVLEEIRAYQAEGHRILITSGSFAPVVSRFAQKAGVEECLATPIDVIDGRLTGRVAGSENTGSSKAANLRRHLEGSAPDVAYGDTFADYEMLKMSRVAVVVEPDRKLSIAANAHGWRVIRE